MSPVAAVLQTIETKGLGWYEGGREEGNHAVGTMEMRIRRSHTWEQDSFSQEKPLGTRLSRCSGVDGPR